MRYSSQRQGKGDWIHHFGITVQAVDASKSPVSFPVATAIGIAIPGW